MQAERTAPSKSDLNRYQRAEVERMEASGFTFVRVRRLQDDLNDWASVDMCDDVGDLVPTAIPVSQGAFAGDLR